MTSTGVAEEGGGAGGGGGWRLPSAVTDDPTAGEAVRARESGGDSSSNGAIGET